ncbi:serine hydrolase domain-containing protein [Vulcaniibacterium tengchongense]|uniref:CubicO group peptidase (Beta-lactamase class C family) n=1 Tax=Vulcaniibacterium tengchongense TaxID=1273429 RepID=A0A3N4VRU6_9GAMM|nr:serine hydrolase [Vulcaniibacterium tengchongense]RPE81931.1 CubicO group peptidase (beta-lactamase class C family) [Vulcaniibacterium tengchongense]
MPRFARFVLAAALLCAAPAFASDYVPPRHEWARQAPAAAGFDPAKLAEAVEYAKGKAEVEPSDLRQVLLDAFGKREPGYRILGPVIPRAQASGLIVRGGRIVAEWGDLDRVDMTFSVAKSYLATVAGLAVDDGLIASVDDRVARYVPGPWFEGAHNGAITWTHLLQQTSDWSGTLWDVPDWADRPEGDDPSRRPLHAPGTRYKYNDVRVNLLAFGLLQVLREPLPQVLKARIMDPIGASSTWRWHGYGNSWTEVDGLRMQSVSGGGHFGGGLFVSTADHARFGLLMLREGEWGGRRLLSKEWIARATRPSPAKPDYGYLWWLNTGRQAIPAAPESAYWASGFGGHYLYIDREHDLLIVLRWTPDLAGVVTRVLAALRPRA